jgi:GNAT superfamily N-acetyltransferase
MRNFCAVTEVLVQMEATWPPAECRALGPVTLRLGAGGGQRVSAATVAGAWTAKDLARAKTAMRQIGQNPLFMLTPDQTDLDRALAAQGYQIKDPVVVYQAACPVVAGEGPAYMTTFAHWPPMEIAKTLWLDGHIGPPRVAIMQRVTGARTAVLARAQDRAAGVAFVALSGDLAFVHAVHVGLALRRQGAAQNLMRAAAVWAASQGAGSLASAVTAANLPARALYASLGMEVVGQYHYRVRPE